jgi:hypothetical protein
LVLRNESIDPNKLSDKKTSDEFWDARKLAKKIGDSILLKG